MTDKNKIIEKKHRKGNICCEGCYRIGKSKAEEEQNKKVEELRKEHEKTHKFRNVKCEFCYKIDKIFSKNAEGKESIKLMRMIRK